MHLLALFVKGLVLSRGHARVLFAFCFRLGCIGRNRSIVVLQFFSWTRDSSIAQRVPLSGRVSNFLPLVGSPRLAHWLGGVEESIRRSLASLLMRPGVALNPGIEAAHEHAQSRSHL
jgi:hypothetical protein